MPREHFRHVRTWVFDLDNTLYPPECRLFDLIEVRMTDYVMRLTGAERAEADRLRAVWWREHGTTLAGLMAHHRADPDPYLADVHDIPLDRLAPDPVLAGAIGALPGRKIVFTNGSTEYARRVVMARGLQDIFDGIYGIEHSGYVPKPNSAAFHRVFEQDGLNPAQSAMFEDDAVNLRVPHSLGVRTVHVAAAAGGEPFVDHHTSDLAGFLARLV
jgi:putative hydrolase of the HAD superfamily